MGKKDERKQQREENYSTIFLNSFKFLSLELWLLVVM